ncbi:hypothetical protein CU097_002004, partial [Rhizopus azygosporus]
VLAEEKKRRVSKRAQKLEEKLKNRSVTSLFDTDGDLSKHNIIEGSRQTRKRTASTEEMPNKRKRPDSRVLIKNARDKLMPKPTTELDKTRNEAILQRQHELEKILDQHESKVKELYHLEMYQNMLDFDPKKNLVNDLIYQKFIQDFNLWDIAYNTSQHKNTVQLLESTIRSGTGTRRLIKQYKKLNDYLSTFVTATDDEEMTPEAREALIEKERGIRQRLDQLYQAGGFTTQLQAIAHRRPHQPPRQHDLFHDTLLAHVQSSAKLFAANSKYRRNMARKCARAVERYWENIWAQDE